MVASPGLSIETVSGSEDSLALAPRHLALLSVVSAAEPRGITRDRVVGILWAKAGEQQARHNGVGLHSRGRFNGARVRPPGENCGTGCGEHPSKTMAEM